METQTFKIEQNVEPNVIVETKMTGTPCTWRVRVFFKIIIIYIVYKKKTETSSSTILINKKTIH
jgi:hypothetical protein